MAWLVGAFQYKLHSYFPGITINGVTHYTHWMEKEDINKCKDFLYEIIVVVFS